MLDLYGQFEPSPWQLLQLGFFSLKFHFGKSPPLSINPKSAEWANSGGCAPEIGNKKAARRRLSCAMEPATGLEPVTPALRERCSTN